jgi:methylated-DNA-[protein]-cysteine S-methyltransferase
VFTLEVLDTPIGRVALATRDGEVWATEFERPGPPLQRFREAQAGETFLQPPSPTPAAQALARYFADPDINLNALPLRLHGSPFEMRVWNALREIPCRETVSYGWIAKRIGEPGGAQAVGRANNRNPIPIIVPCHRVIGMDGAMVGFGGGLHRKVWLLDHEQGGRLL